MGLAARRISRELIAHGLSPRTPAAIIQQGTSAGQRVVAGTLAALPRLAAEARLRAPTLIVIGKVVRLRKALDWFSEGQRRVAKRHERRSSRESV